MAKIKDYPVVYQYTGNGATRAFQFRCMFWEVSNMVVYLNHTIQTSGYTITSDDFSEGGTVTFNTAPANGVKITIKRVLPKKRLTEFYESGVFRADPTNEEINHIYALIQGNADDIERRCVKVTDTDDQTPEELLEEVYNKLDSATEIAAQAIGAANEATTAAENATAAVASAEETLRNVTAYVDEAETRINETKTTAETNITNTASTAVTTINSAVAAAEDRVDNKVTTAEASIDQTISDAIGEVTQAAVAAAQEAIDNATTTVTAAAKSNLNDYVDNTVEPSLQSYVTAAQAAQAAAAESASTASTKAAQASSSATAARQYEQSSEENKDATLEALNRALELAGYQIIYGGAPADGVEDVIIGGLIQ